MATVSATTVPATEQRAVTLRTLLAGSYLALLAPAITLLLLWAGVQLQQAAFEQAQYDLLAQAASVAELLREPLEHGLEGGRVTGGLTGLVTGSARATGRRITILDARRRVLLSSEQKIAPGETAGGPELTVDGPRYDHRIDSTTGDGRLFAAAPLLEEGRDLMGFVQISTPAESVAAGIRAKWAMLAGAGLLLFGAVAGVSLAVARTLAGPVQRLTAATEALAAGNLEQPVVPGGPEEIRRLARAFDRMRARVRETLQLQEEFVANAAHELRSPLAGMRLRLELLETHGRERPELVDEYLPKLRDEIASLERQVEQLLALSVAQDRGQVSRTTEDLASLLYELADQYGPLAGHAGLGFAVEVPDHLAPVTVSREQMRMAVRNLLENAIKFTAAGGQVALRARMSGGVLEITIADTGCGIAPEAQGRIFERFYREDRSRQGRTGGAGLGLALVKAVAESHGGAVAVQSSPGTGSTFIITLPLPTARS